jgi:hypothetical protein
MIRGNRLSAALGPALLFAAGLATAAASAPRVLAVSPSGPAVPENLLRISIRFDAPPKDQVLRGLSLAFGDGRTQDAPFLDQELWSPDGRVLTVLLHPGRVKTGLVAHEQLGAILAEGESVQLMLDGRPVARWVVGPRDVQGPSPAGWRPAAVRAGRRDPLVVRLEAPIDARDADYVAVVDAQHRRVLGHPELLEGEQVWRFTPAKAWSAGPYQLVARGTLEDPAGNRLNSRFERDAEQRPESARDVAIPLEVTRRP